MRVFSRPVVKLISQPTIKPDSFFSFLREKEMEWPEFKEKVESGFHLGDIDGEWIPEIAGRTCYMSFGRGRTHEDYLKHILEVGHGSVLEHAYYNFIIWGVSRSLTHELVRHRVGTSYSQLSQRYVDERETNFVVPPGVQAIQSKSPELYEKWLAHMEASRKLYTELTDGLEAMYSDLENPTDRRKKARQAARSVLPNATETVMYFGANIRALRHLIEMRAHPAADLEIRELFVMVFEIMRNHAPAAFDDMQVVTLSDGTRGVESLHKKV